MPGRIMAPEAEDIARRYNLKCEDQRKWKVMEQNDLACGILLLVSGVLLGFVLCLVGARLGLF